MSATSGNDRNRNTVCAIRSSKSKAFARRISRSYDAKISRNTRSTGSLMLAWRANDSASASSFFSFEMRPITDDTVSPYESASCCLTRRLISAFESPES